MTMVVRRLLEPKFQIPEERKTYNNHQLIALIAPIIIEQLLATLVGMVDTMMISYVGETAVSGVSLVNQLNMMFILIFTAMASGGAVVVSQYIGSKQRDMCNKASGQLIMIGGVIGLVIMLIILGGRVGIFGALFGKVEPAVRESGLLYLKISAYSYIPLAVYNACAGLYRSMSKTKELMYVSIIMNVINVIGNAIGVFVLHAGVRGVAYPSLISRAFAMVVMLALLMGRNDYIKIRLKDIFAWDGPMLRRIFHIALPNGIENGLFQFARVALTSILASYGTIHIAAYGVAQNLWSLAALFPLSMGPAFITVIGQYMGARDIEGADYYMKKLLRITYIGSIIWCLFFFVVSPFILNLYDISAETRHLVLVIIILHNLFDALLSPPAFPLSTGLRAAGDVRFTMFSAIFCTVGCRVFFSVLFGSVLGMGVVGITWGMIADWGIKAIMIWWRYKSGKWTQFKVI